MKEINSVDERTLSRPIPICTTVPYKVVLSAKEQRIPLNQIFLRGWQAVNEHPQYISRIRELESENSELQRKVERISLKLGEVLSK